MEAGEGGAQGERLGHRMSTLDTLRSNLAPHLPERQTTTRRAASLVLRRMLRVSLMP